MRRVALFLLALCLALPPAALLLMPTLQITGSDMRPTLCDGDIALALPGRDCQRGDVVAFECENRLLVKRVVALAGDTVMIEKDGAVSVNGKPLEEPYVPVHAFGKCNVEMPCEVPEGAVFLLGDERMNAVDSRNTSVGCVPREKIMGKVVLRVWPISALGIVN